MVTITLGYKDNIFFYCYDITNWVPECNSDIHIADHKYLGTGYQIRAANIEFSLLRGIFFPCEKRAKKKIDFSNVKWWAPYSWGTNLSMYPPYSQPYLSGFMLINLKMSLLHSVRLLLVRLLLRPM